MSFEVRQKIEDQTIAYTAGAYVLIIAQDHTDRFGFGRDTVGSVSCEKALQDE